MTWTPISGSVPQYQAADGSLASGYYLKTYSAGTTTPLSMATDSTGGTTLAKAQINTAGYPINGSGDVFIPHVSQSYKIVLYKNATDADNDTTGNADWVVDNIIPNADETSVNNRVFSVSTDSALKALTPLNGYQASLVNEEPGIFEFSATNLSAKVTQDTNEDVYIPPSSDVTGASGAWVRKDADDVRLSRYANNGDTLAPSVFENALALANRLRKKFIIDVSCSLSGDVLIDEKSHIVLLPSVTVSMQNSPTWDNGIGAVDGTRYNGCMFTFRTGSEGSFFEGYGVLDINSDNAGSVSGEGVTSGAITMIECDDIRVDGSFTIINAFNGVVPVDSDYCRIDGYTFKDVASSANNAAVDAEGSDHGFIGSRVLAIGSTEAVDFNVYCRHWEVFLKGIDCTQAVLEVNNGYNINGTVHGYNSACVNMFNYASGSTATQRWTRRGRSHQLNEACEIKGVAYFDTGYTQTTLQFQPFKIVDGCKNGRLEFNCVVVGSAGRFDQLVFIQDTDGSSTSGNEIHIKAYSDSDVIFTGKQPIRLDRLVDSYVSVDIKYPAPAGMEIVQVLNGQFRSTLDIKNIDGVVSTGDAVKLEFSSSIDLEIQNANNIHRVSNKYDLTSLTSSDSHYWRPYLEGTTANRPGNAVTSNGQPYLDTDLRRMVYFDRAAATWRNSDGMQAEAYLENSATIDPASVAAGSFITFGFGVTGAALGDFAQVSFDQDLQDLVATASVRTADNCDVTLYNPTGSPIDLPSGTVRVRVAKNGITP